jgi:four helix bundle protein
MEKRYIKLQNLKVYQLARKLSKVGWEIYEGLDWQIKKIMGDQFIESTDSVGANIAEGYSRYHYLEKIKFLYNARASLSECQEHWLELLNERNKVDKDKYKKFKTIAEKLSIKLQNFITANYKQKNNL